jgi:23S rRNA (cytosine1962-C5)-methyltransferase
MSSENEPNSMKLFTPNNWKNYELIDAGDGEKLERFGKLISRRPEPQALWSKLMPESEWQKLAHVSFCSKGKPQRRVA